LLAEASRPVFEALVLRLNFCAGRMYTRSERPQSFRESWISTLAASTAFAWRFLSAWLVTAQGKLKIALTSLAMP